MMVEETIGSAEGTLARKSKSKIFYFPFAILSLIRTIGFAEGTSVRKSKSKIFYFSFAILSLIRTFAAAMTLGLTWI